MDFLMIAQRTAKKGVTEIYPKFIVRKSEDLMIRGQDFFAIWNDKTQLWSTNEEDAIYLIDKALDDYYNEHSGEFQDHVKVLHLWDAETGMIDRWHKYCQKQMRDNFHNLDERLIFSNSNYKRTDYASKKLPYPLEHGDHSAYDELISTLYSPEERQKIEWAIGAIVSGDSKNIQKFLVMYGSAGTGKSTILNIIQKLFEGYYCVFDSKALGQANNSFALEPFKTNPLVAIQHDGDLSKIEDNTRLNSVVSHELMTVNEKFKATYSNRFNCFLMLGTNKPVRITDAKSGIIRRLIDVSPTGNKVSMKKYKELISKIDFELGPIAAHCLDVYTDNLDYYDDYIPQSMMGATNDFYNFIIDNFDLFKRNDGVSLKNAWKLYKDYCEDARVPYPLPLRNFKEEMKNYFKDFNERGREGDIQVRNYYSGFITKKFMNEMKEELTPVIVDDPVDILGLKEGIESEFDKMAKDWPAQLANADDKPSAKWNNVLTVLSDIDTHDIHYVRVPVNHIVIDFDIKDENGNKSFKKNCEAAAKWPKTYTEVSKGGAGIHLHYIYTGDVEKLARLYDTDIEIKVFTGNSSLRRRLTLCNDIPVAKISSGLPQKEEKMVDKKKSIENEKQLRKMIIRNLNKEIHPNTKPSVDFIFKLLEDAHESGMHYDVTDMRPAIKAFALGSNNQAEACLKMVSKMKWRSEEAESDILYNEENDDVLVFVDTEVFSNVLIICYKPEGEDKECVRMINPRPEAVEALCRHKLVGFNNRQYDNHILYAAMMGYTTEQLYNLSCRIVSGESRNCFFSEAYNLSYTDVYDFSSKKQSLKKWEIELDIHHLENAYPWDQPLAEEHWDEVAEYCCNDVRATEAVFNARQADWTARKVLADISGLSVNDKTNSHTTRIIFGNEKKPQGEFLYRDLSKPIPDDIWENVYKPWFARRGMRSEMENICFPGYSFENGKSSYKWVEEVGEGGRVYAEPGIYYNVGLMDIASMHPSSTEDELSFGEYYTNRFSDLKLARILIKHGEYDECAKLLDGAFAPYLKDKSMAKDLAQALKIAINSVYGLTSAKFDNPFRDPRNVDNIVAKRGALFMIDLEEAVKAEGYTVVHIKTDSIKVCPFDDYIYDFIMKFGKRYGYDFELEAIYDRICLVNDAVYIAKYSDNLKINGDHANHWTATGAQFQHPYIFKYLFSDEPMVFKDFCETKTVKTALYLDMNEEASDSKEELSEEDHNYIFVGKAGSFVPIMPGYGGGELLRLQGDKYYSATGAKGWRWLEAEVVKANNMEDKIDMLYFDCLAADAIRTINKYGDFDIFVDHEIIKSPELQNMLAMAKNNDEVPFEGSYVVN